MIDTRESGGTIRRRRRCRECRGRWTTYEVDQATWFRVQAVDEVSRELSDRMVPMIARLDQVASALDVR